MIASADFLTRRIVATTVVAAVDSPALGDDQLLPWADPYIASLFAEQAMATAQGIPEQASHLEQNSQVELRRAAAGSDGFAWEDGSLVRAA